MTDLSRERLAFHGLAVFILALAVAIPFAIIFSRQHGGTQGTHLWEVAHLEGMLHGLLLMGLSAIGPRIVLKPTWERWAVIALVAGAYGATIGSAVSAAFDVDGLAPGGSVANTVAWLLLGIGTVGVSIGIVLCGVGAWGAFKQTDEGPQKVLQIPEYKKEPKHTEVVQTTNWNNWADTVRANPVRIERPTSLEELRDAVKTAYDQGFRIRAVGGGYSWSPMAATNGVLIDVTHLNRPMATKMGGEGRPPTVEVEAGMTIHELTHYAEQSSLTLETTTVIPFVEVGGAIAMGCHGTGWKVPTFSDLARSMQVVDARGDVKRYERDDSDTWKALLVNLGALGIVYSVEFDCVPMFYVEAIDETADMRKTIDDVKSLVERNEYTELFWFPFNDGCLVKTWNTWKKGDPDPHHLPHESPLRRGWEDIAQAFENDALGPVMMDALIADPKLTPSFMRRMFSMMPKLQVICPAPWAMQYQAAFIKVVDMGYAIPVDQTSDDPFGKVKKAWLAAVDKLNAYADRGEFPQNMVLHARFVGVASSALLSPTTGFQGTCYLEVLTYGKTPGYPAYFAELEREWIAVGGRPHWAKLFYEPKRVGEMYGENMERFLAVREKLDPEQVFMNDALREIFHIS